MIAYLLVLLIGLILGWYGRTVKDYVHQTFLILKESRDMKQAGVVKPEVRRGSTRVPETDLTSASGPIMRMSPNEVLAERMKERNENIKRMSR